jgi:diguanylate cyclase (GGDEF)-like protein
MKDNVYNQLKTVINSFTIPGTIFSVEKKPDGSCGDICFFAINEHFKKSSYDLYSSTHPDEKIQYEGFELKFEGQPYAINVPKEPNFEEICFRAAWKNEHIHTYVDTRKMYGYWTENIMLPVNIPHPENISYCIFLYTLNKELDTGKFADVSPEISSYVLKICLELRNESDFYTSMDLVTNDLRNYSNSYAACIMTIDKEQKSFEIISEAMEDSAVLTIREIFSTMPYKIVASWEKALSETNSILIKDEKDMNVVAQKAPEWVANLKEHNVSTLALVPFIHQGEIIGYLYLTNFEVQNIIKIKEIIELVAFFLTAEIANHIFMGKLEYLSNVDILTGVLNRNCMNIDVDEFSLKLKLNPKPFSVAFCDLNGLKIINDKKGHSVGDKLIKEAATLLKEIFTDNYIYRAGGDEFAIISLTDSEEEFIQKIDILRQKANDTEWLYFAIGYYHDKNGSSLRKAMRYADERMYKDKKAFYQKHPEKKR